MRVVWVLLLVGACETEFFAESKELIEAVEEGESLKTIGEEAQQVVDAFKKERDALKAKATKAKAFIADAKSKLDHLDAQAEEKLEILEARMQAAQEQLDGAGTVGEDVAKTLQDIENEIKALLDKEGAEDGDAEAPETPAPE